MSGEGFPRGKAAAEATGGEETSQRKNKRKKNDEDQLFKTKKSAWVEAEYDVGRGLKSSGKKKNQLTGEEERVLAGRQKIGERGFDIQQLTYETITEGLLTLGTVSSIRGDQEVIVSLPGRTVGSIALADVSRAFSSRVEKALKPKRRVDNNDDDEESPSLSSIFFVGQTVVVRVESKTTNEERKTRVRLSSCPSKVNGQWVSGEVNTGLTLTGALLSEGEKAWEVDTGINGIKGFLQKSKIRGDITGGIPLSVGRILFFRVDSCGGSGFRKTVQLSLVDSNKERCTIPDDMPLTYTQLLPGMTFREVVIMESHKTGIKVHLHDDLTGLLWQDHLGPDKGKGEEGKHKAQVLKGVRVLYVNPSSVAPTPYLTLQRKAIPFSGRNKSNQPLGPPVKIGEAVEVIVDTIQKRGVLVRCAQIKGIVPAGRLSDNLLKQAAGDLKKDKNALTVGQKRKCLIVGYSEWDELFVGSFQESLLEGKNITTAGQLKVGQILKNVTVLRWTAGGALLGLTNSSGATTSVKAFLPLIHIPPSVKPLASKYPVGSTISTVRVVEINPSTCHVIVTALNALVKSKGAVIETYEEISKLLARGSEVRSHGLVKYVVGKYGVTIRLLGGTQGFVPISKMGEERRKTFANLKPGEVVEVNVLSVIDDEYKKMTLAFVEDVEKISEGAQKRKNDKNEVATSEEPPAKKSKNEKANKAAKAKPLKEKQHQEKEKVKKSTVPSQKKILKISEEEDTFDFNANTSQLENLPAAKSKRSTEEKQRKTSNDFETKNVCDESEKNQQQTTKAVKQGKGKHLKLSEEELRQSVRVNPRDGEAWVKLAYMLLEEAGIYDEGGPRAGAGSDIGRVKRVVEEGISALSGFESYQKVTLWAIAVSLESLGSTKGQDTSDAVLKKLNEGMKAVNPVELIIKAAEAFERMKDFKNAEVIYKKGMKKDEVKVPPAYVRMLYKVGRPEDAAKVFKSVIEYAKDPLRLAVQQGTIELQLGDKKKGIDLYKVLLGGDQASKMKKRVDLLTIILNTAIKYGTYNDVSSIFDMIIKLSVPPLKLRCILKIMKEYEAKEGSDKSRAEFQETTHRIIMSL